MYAPLRILIMLVLGRQPILLVFIYGIGYRIVWKISYRAGSVTSKKFQQKEGVEG